MKTRSEDAKNFLYIKKSDIGYEMALKYVYKVEAILTLQTGFVEFS
jgi:hypothetical protein